MLGFDRYPSQKQITSHCRKLSSKWHPDRFTRANDTEKKNAEKMFIDIQKACGMMDKLKIKRERHNTWSDGDQSETIVTETHDDYTETDDVNTQNAEDKFEDKDVINDEVLESGTCDYDSNCPNEHEENENIDNEDNSANADAETL